MATVSVPLINGIAYGWADITVLIGGVPVTGITAIKYTDEQEVTNIYGAGRYPVARGKGRITPTASITLLVDEVIALQANSTTGRLQDIAAFDVQVSYIPDNGKVVHDVIRNCQFSKNERDWSEGDASKTTELTLIPSHIEWGTL
jgi:hypothetical protein